VGVLLKGLLVCVTLNHHRFVKDELAALGVIAPDASGLRESRCAAEFLPQHL